MTDRRQTRKKRNIAWRVVLIVVLAGMSWFAYFRWSVSRRLAKQIAALASQGYPVTLDQLNDWYQLPDGADNAADYYIEAFARRVEWNREAAMPLPFVGSASLPEPNATLDPNTLALMQDYLKDNAEAFQWLDKGAQCQHANYPVDYQMASTAPMPWLSDIRHGVQLYGLKMLLAIEQGQANAYLQAFSGGMALAGSLRSMPSYISQLVSTACMGTLTMGVMERGLSSLEFMDDQLLQLSNGLELYLDAKWLIRANAGEACLILDGLTDSLMQSGNGSSGQRQWSSLITPYRLLGLMDRDLCEYLTLTQDLRNPPSNTVQALLIAGDLAETRRQAIPKSHFLLHRMSPIMGRITKINARYHAGQVSAQTALAVLRYRLKADTLPETLAALVPQYMSAVPVDPFDGESLRYVKQANGFMVYSVDEDGQDNGGRKRAPKNGDKPYDLVFSVQTQD